MYLGDSPWSISIETKKCRKSWNRFSRPSVALLCPFLTAPSFARRELTEGVGSRAAYRLPGCLMGKFLVKQASCDPNRPLMHDNPSPVFPLQSVFLPRAERLNLYHSTFRRRPLDLDDAVVPGILA